MSLAPLPALLILTLLGVAGCSRGTDGGGPLELQVIQAGRAAIQARRAARNPPPVLTRAVLDTVEGGLLEVTLERRNQRAYLYVAATRADAGPGSDSGRIVVWRTGDDVTLAMRDGVLFSTRGLGGDILSGDVRVAGNRPGPASGEKIFDIRALDNKTRRLTLLCETADLGPATIEIIGRTHATRHIRETCAGGTTTETGSRTGGQTGSQTGQVVNDYWVGSGLVWQSRQWAGPEAGYLRIRRVSR